MSESEPVVDVIIPSHNRQRLTLEAVESVRAQTFRRWRLLVVDDASEEPLDLRGLMREDRRIVLLRREHRGGQQAARQTGFEASTAELIAVLDSDDIWEPIKLELQVDRFMSKREELADLGAVLCWHVWVDMEGHPRGPVRRPEVDGSADPLISDNMSALLVSREAVQRAGGFLPRDAVSLPVNANIEFFVRLTQVCSFTVAEEMLVRCRHHDGGRTSDLLGTLQNVAALSYVMARHEHVFRRYPDQRATLLARLGVRYLEAGYRKEGFESLLASTRASTFRSALRVVHEFGWRAARAAAIGR